MASHEEIPGLESSISAKSASFEDKLDALVATLHWLIIQEGTKCLQSDGEVCIQQISVICKYRLKQKCKNLKKHYEVTD